MHNTLCVQYSFCLQNADIRMSVQAIWIRHRICLFITNLSSVRSPVNDPFSILLVSNFVLRCPSEVLFASLRLNQSKKLFLAQQYFYVGQIVGRSRAPGPLHTVQSSKGRDVVYTKLRRCCDAAVLNFLVLHSQAGIARTFQRTESNFSVKHLARDKRPCSHYSWDVRGESISANKCVLICTEVAAYTDKDLRDLTTALDKFNEKFKFVR